MKDFSVNSSTKVTTILADGVLYLMNKKKTLL